MFLAADLSMGRFIFPAAWIIIYVILQKGILKEDPICPCCEESLPLLEGLAFCPSCGKQIFEDVPQKENKPVKHIISQKTAARFDTVMLIFLIVFWLFSMATSFLGDSDPWGKIAAIALLGVIIISDIVSAVIRKYCVCPHCFGKLPSQKVAYSFCPYCGEKTE